LLVSPDYLRLRATLVEVLRAHPAAAIDVARAVAKLETDAAAEITVTAARKPPVELVGRPEPVDAEFVEVPPPPPPAPTNPNWHPQC
jgi:hypothetical protein